MNITKHNLTNLIIIHRFITGVIVPAEQSGPAAEEHFQVNNKQQRTQLQTMQTHSVSGYTTEMPLVAEQTEGLFVHVCCSQRLLHVETATTSGYKRQLNINRKTFSCRTLMSPVRWQESCQHTVHIMLMNRPGSEIKVIS